ncbi:hypothetical protein ABGB16_21550 [Micromonospora sp. B11E3]|uniref:hypothetical protein n=1 Tax=Micromonospora sp. B11E3 TaxID=3153562 RepID=UPI00325C3FA0
MLDTSLRMAAAIVVVVGLGAVASFAALAAIVEARNAADAELLTEVRAGTAHQQSLARSLANEVHVLSQHIGQWPGEAMPETHQNNAFDEDGHRCRPAPDGACRNRDLTGRC